jgi:antirestriction protein ArdC
MERKRISDDITAKLTDTIVSALESGTVPWRMPWSGTGIGGHRSVATGKHYRGINQLTLAIHAATCGYSSPYWMTYRQAEEFGGNVRKGSKGMHVVYWKLLRVSAKDPETGETGPRTVPMLRYFTVFNVSQVEGLSDDARRKYGDIPVTVRELPPDDAADRAAIALRQYHARAGIRFEEGGQSAYYVPKLDEIRMPLRNTFASAAHYSAVLAHETVHATGTESRLNRQGVTGYSAFGSETYSREELVAEIGAAMIAQAHRFDTPDVVENRNAYLASWAKFLRSDPRAMIVAASRAQDAANLILGEEEESQEEETAVTGSEIVETVS